MRTPGNGAAGVAEESAGMTKRRRGGKKAINRQCRRGESGVGPGRREPFFHWRAILARYCARVAGGHVYNRGPFLQLGT
ncbi:hypothetical protein BWU74_24055 [Paraburkholderia caledonica]|nr:hypothetical protein BWU74_24055 [Burkholderia sp. Bk]